MNLYLKYRPRTVEELDLVSVRKALNEIIASGNTSHAYLFTGPRGAGKTSAARILARIVNCEKNRKKLGEPCNECDSCKAILNNSAVDVVEIDAASNRGIDDVRELKEKIKLAPAILPKKVYIIDEVHMMTTDAFNALLKTLEEPPLHSLFILCTTEAHKVPETIVSRCTRIKFTKATVAEMKRSFSRVIKGEKGEAEEEALELLSTAVDGSFRDGVKLLDQVLLKGIKINKKMMEEEIYGSSGHSGKLLAQALANKEMSEALKVFREATAQGVDLTYLLTDLMREIKILVVEGNYELIELIYQLDETARKLSTSPVPAILAEVTLIKWCAGSDNQKTQRVSKSDASESRSKSNLKQEKTIIVEEEIQVQKPVEMVEKIEMMKANINTDSGEVWNKMMGGITGEDYSMGALLSKARPGMISGSEFTIEVKYDFHREQIMNSKFRARIEELVSKVAGGAMTVKCVVNPAMDKLKRPVEEDILLTQAEEIFSNSN